jgi:hypothetical protein
MENEPKNNPKKPKKYPKSTQVNPSSTQAEPGLYRTRAPIDARRIVCLTPDCSLVYSWKVWRVVSSAPALPSSCLKSLFSGLKEIRPGAGPAAGNGRLVDSKQDLLRSSVWTCPESSQYKPPKAIFFLALLAVSSFFRIFNL